MTKKLALVVALLLFSLSPSLTLATDTHGKIVLADNGGNEPTADIQKDQAPKDATDGAKKIEKKGSDEPNCNN